MVDSREPFKSAITATRKDRNMAKDKIRITKARIKENTKRGKSDRMN
jgi:hypothetical protein